MRAAHIRRITISMTNAGQPCPRPDPAAARWSVGGLLVEAVAARDFGRVADCFEPDATMRALLPSGPATFEGPDEIAASFRRWFGGADGFEVVDATVGDVGTRLHVAWRLRVDSTPRGARGWHVIEQQAYCQTAERIEALDLLCSGFVPDERR